MAVLPNPKHELFAQGLAKGLDLEVAYRAAGYRGDRKVAAFRAKKDDIKGRVAEIQAETLRKTQQTRVVTVESVHLDLDRAEDVAARTGNAKVLLEIAVARAKLGGLGGLFVEQSASVRINVDVGTMRSADIKQALLDKMLKGEISQQDLQQIANGTPSLAGPVIDG